MDQLAIEVHRQVLIHQTDYFYTKFRESLALIIMTCVGVSFINIVLQDIRAV